MRTRFRELTAKYKSFRSIPDALYDSRLFQIFAGKFIKNGKKNSSLKHIRQSLHALRFYSLRMRPFTNFQFMVKKLHLPLIILPRRKGKIVLNVPVPTRRNKKDFLSTRTLYKAIQKRRERTLKERLFQEFYSLLASEDTSETSRQHNALLFLIYEERVNLNRR